MAPMNMDNIVWAIIAAFVSYMIYKMLVKYIRPQRQSVADIPRDSMIKVRRDVLRSARISKPFGLKELRISGDHEVPNSRMGRIVGLLPTLNYYIISYHRGGKRRTLLAEREFVSRVSGYTLTVKARGIQSHGELWDFAIPLDNFAKVLSLSSTPEDDQLNELWSRRAAAIAILMEQHANIERIEIRRHAEIRAVLPKAQTRVLLAGRYEEADTDV